MTLIMSTVFGIEPRFKDRTQQVGSDATDHPTDDQTQQVGRLFQLIDPNFQDAIHEGSGFTTPFVNQGMRQGRRHGSCHEAQRIQTGNVKTVPFVQDVQVRPWG